MVSRSSSSADGLLTMKRAQFVAVRIAKVARYAPLRRTPGGSLDELCDHLGGRAGCEASACQNTPWSRVIAAVGVRRCLAIDRLAHHGTVRRYPRQFEPASGILLAGLAADHGTAHRRISSTGRYILRTVAWLNIAAPSTINDACSPLRWHTRTEHGAAKPGG